MRSLRKVVGRTLLQNVHDLLLLCSQVEHSVLGVKRKMRWLTFRYINRLSDANRMLLLNFMSLLTSLSGFENNKAIAALANYFASALFVRPYYPGDSKKVRAATSLYSLLHF